MFNHKTAYKIYTDNNNRSYYNDNNNYKTLINSESNLPTFGEAYFKGISCNNGINNIIIQGVPAYYNKNGNSSSSFVTLTEYVCNNINNNQGPVNNISIKSNISNILNSSIDCGNHPITYLNINKDNIQYSCGNNLTKTAGTNMNLDLEQNLSEFNVLYFNYDNGNNKYYYQSNTSIDNNTKNNFKNNLQNTKYILLNDKHELGCENNDQVITKIQFKNNNNQQQIKFICKNLAEDNTSNKTSANNVSLLKTLQPKLIQKINVKTDDYRNPTKFWFDFNYSTTSTPLTNIKEKSSDNSYKHPFVGVNCEGNAITSLSFENGKIDYACGTPLKNLTNYEYTEQSSPMLYRYYDSGVLFDRVECPNNSVLSGFSRTITKDGPKVKWICGNV